MGEWECSCGLINGARGMKGPIDPNAQCRGQSCRKSFKHGGKPRDTSTVPNVWKFNNSIDTTPSRASNPYTNAAPRSNTVQNGTRASGYTAISQRSSTVPTHHTSSKITSRVKSVDQSITQNKNSPGARDAGGWKGWFTRANEERERSKKLDTPKKKRGPA